MQPSKEPERAVARAEGRPAHPEENRVPEEAPRSGPRSGPIFEGGRAGRPARRISFLGCLLLLLLHLQLRHPAEAANRSGPAATEVLLEGERREREAGIGALALRRPKPGSIWQGPKELWCKFPPGQGAGSILPAEAADPDAPPAEASPPPPAEASPPPPYLSPLVLFFMTLPTLEEVACYFAEALGENPVIDGPQRLRFERLLGFVWGKSWRRCVLSGGARGAPGVTLDWWTNDDFGLSELREFFEAPFFRECESIRFYQWLGEGGAHEADFRGHRLRMVMGKRDGVFFVRIQWWRSAPEADSSQGLLDFNTLEQTSAPTGTAAGSGVCVRREERQAAGSPRLGCRHLATALGRIYGIGANPTDAGRMASRPCLTGAGRETCLLIVPPNRHEWHPT